MKDKKLIIGVVAALLVVGAAGYILSSRKSAPPSDARSDVHYAFADDQSAWLEIPDAALPDGVKASDIKVTKVDAAATTGDGAPLAVYDFQPDGLQFKSPVKLSVKTIAWDDTVPELVRLSGKGDAADEPVEGASARFDLRDRTVTVSGEIAHFTKYAVAAGIFHVVSVKDIAITAVGSTFKVPFQVFYKSVNTADTVETYDQGKKELKVHTVRVVEGDPKVSGVYQFDNEVVEPLRVAKPDNEPMGDTEYKHEETFTCKAKGTYNVHVDVSFLYKYKITETRSYEGGRWDAHKDELVSRVGKVEFVLDGSCTDRSYEGIRALEIDNALYAAAQFHIAAPDACDAPHWHANGRVYGLVMGQRYKAVSMVDPAPKACGFGRIPDVNTVWTGIDADAQKAIDAEKAKFK